MYRNVLPLILLLVVFTSEYFIVTEKPIEIRIEGNPIPLSISIDGMYVGETPISIKKSPGIYMIKATAPGFEDFSKTYVVDGFFLATVEENKGSQQIKTQYMPIIIEPIPKPELLKFFSYGQIEWDHNRNIIQYGKANLVPQDNSVYVLNLETRAIVSSEPAINTIKDETVINSLNAYKPVFVSPDGKYLLYGSKIDASIRLYNLNNNEDIKIWELGQNKMLAFFVEWSDNNKVIRIYREPNNDIQVFMDTKPPQIIFVSIFKDKNDKQNDEMVIVDRMVSRCSQKRICIALGYKPSQSKKLWLVDTKTNTGIPIPLEGAQTAVFTPNEDAVIVAASEGIFRLSLDFKEKILISSIVSGKWNWRNIKFSYTLDYVYFEAGYSESPSSWIYKIPPYKN
jgi:WD40 repeat protein